MVESVLGPGEVTMRVLGEVEGMVGAAQGALEVARHGVDRAELRQLGAGLAASGDHVFVCGAHDPDKTGQAPVCLETVLLPGKMAPAERLARAQALRASLPQGKFHAKDIDALKREGRL